MTTTRMLRIRKVARDARSGRFVTRRTALRRPATTVIETYKVPTGRVIRRMKR